MRKQANYARINNELEFLNVLSECWPHERVDDCVFTQIFTGSDKLIPYTDQVDLLAVDFYKERY